MNLRKVLKRDYVQTAVIVIVAILAVLIFWYSLTIVFRTENPILAVASGSMEPVLDENSNGIRIIPKSENDVHIGDIVTFQRGEDLIIFGDGNQSRDFTYIKDVVNANLLAAKHDVSGEIINIACGSPIKLKELAKLILKITGKDYLKITFTEPRRGDIVHSFGDISKALKLLRFAFILSDSPALGLPAVLAPFSPNLIVFILSPSLATTMCDFLG